MRSGRADSFRARSCSWMLARYLSRPFTGRYHFDMRASAAVHLSVLAVAMALFLRITRRQHPLVRYLLPPLAILMFTRCGICRVPELRLYGQRVLGAVAAASELGGGGCMPAGPEMAGARRMDGGRPAGVLQGAARGVGYSVRGAWRSDLPGGMRTGVRARWIIAPLRLLVLSAASCPR